MIKLFLFLLITFMCFQTNALQEVEEQAQKLASFLNQSVDEYEQQKKNHTLTYEELPFLPNINEGFLYFYINLANAIKNASQQDNNFKKYGFKGFKQIIQSFDKWFTLIKPTDEEYKDYHEILKIKTSYSGIDEQKENDKIEYKNFKLYLDSLDSCTYKELLIFSHFLLSVNYSAISTSSYSNIGFHWYQSCLKKFYTENLPKDWHLMSDHFKTVNYNGEFSPAGLAQFASILVFIPCPFVLNSEDFFELFMNDLAPLGMVILPIIADSYLFMPSHFYLHDVSHAVNYLLSFYGYRFDKNLQESKLLLNDKIKEELFQLGHGRRQLMKDMLIIIIKNKKFLSSKSVNKLLDEKIYIETIPHGFYDHTNEMVSAMFNLVIFYLTHELNSSSGFKDIFNQLIFLIGQNDTLYLNKSLENRFSDKHDLVELLLPQMQNLDKDSLIKLYYQTMVTCMDIVKKRTKLNNYPDYKEKYEQILLSMKNISQEFGLPDIEFSSNFFIFKHTGYLNTYLPEKDIVSASFEKDFSSSKTHVLIAHDKFIFISDQ